RNCQAAIDIGVAEVGCNDLVAHGALDGREMVGTLGEPERLGGQTGDGRVVAVDQAALERGGQGGDERHGGVDPAEPGCNHRPRGAKDSLRPPVLDGAAREQLLGGYARLLESLVEGTAHLPACAQYEQEWGKRSGEPGPEGGGPLVCRTCRREVTQRGVTPGDVRPRNDRRREPSLALGLRDQLLVESETRTEIAR